MENKKANRLINEKSPYLLQHAYNPVDWYPWGDEAFEEARRLDRPVFLSVGYSTCHWCHVMAHESFEDEEVAKLLNEGFVCIKVDREERPDIDSVYMRFCQAATGAGGWPLTIIMTPEQKPFYAATYLQKRGGYGRPGLMELLSTVSLRWADSREELEASGDRICDFLNRPEPARSSDKNPAEVIFSAFSQLEMLFDGKNGGFAKAPKFPMPHQLLFLIKHYRQLGDERALAMLKKTLDQMYRGGIFDHIGGGFSRYSTDNEWLIPHFEKMLYDNALLSLTYSEAYNVTGDGLYREVACLCFDYVLGEMTDNEGGFYCAQDADSQGEEGSYYSFRKAEILSLLGDKKGSEFCRRYGIDEKGNFEGRSIANLLDNAEYKHALDGMDEAIALLKSYRKERMELHRDDKELASWNALMIASLARSSFLLERDDYLEAAARSQEAFERHFAREDGSLFLRWRDGEAAFEGHLDDYAFYAWALLELYALTYEVKYLTRAISITDIMLKNFFDEKGGFYLYSERSQKLISRPKETYDGAIPSGNSVAALVLVRLWKLTGVNRWKELFETQLDYLFSAMGDYPAGHIFAVLSATEYIFPSRELVCIPAKDWDPVELSSLLRTLRENIYTVVKKPSNEEELGAAAPYTRDYPRALENDETLYYLCSDGACMPPCNMAGLRELL